MLRFGTMPLPAAGRQVNANARDVLDHPRPTSSRTRRRLAVSGRARTACISENAVQTADGRSRGQRCAALRTAPDRSFINGSCQPIEVVAIFIAARSPRHAPSPFRTSRVVRSASRRSASHRRGGGTPRARVLSQQQSGGLVANEINCELAADRWKVEGKRRIVEHGGCGAGQMHIAIRRNTDLLRELRSHATVAAQFSRW